MEQKEALIRRLSETAVGEPGWPLEGVRMGDSVANRESEVGREVGIYGREFYTEAKTVCMSNQ